MGHRCVFPRVRRLSAWGGLRKTSWKKIFKISRISKCRNWRIFLTSLFIPLVLIVEHGEDPGEGATCPSWVFWIFFLVQWSTMGMYHSCPAECWTSVRTPRVCRRGRVYICESVTTEWKPMVFENILNGCSGFQKVELWIETGTRVRGSRGSRC